jgi:hypothetical protein
MRGLYSEVNIMATTKLLKELRHRIIKTIVCDENVLKADSTIIELKATIGEFKQWKWILDHLIV